MNSNEKLLLDILEMKSNAPFVIAEVGQAHEGSLGQALRFIDAVAGAGANAVKFQTHYADEESSEYDEFRVNVFPQDAKRKDYWRRMEFTPREWKMLADQARSHDIAFLSSPFSNYAVDVLKECGVVAWKVASGELFNYPMIDKIKETGQPLLISTGMSSWREIDEINLYTAGTTKAFFQCTTEYPSKPINIGLNNIQMMRDRYPESVVGLSDHSGDIYPSMSALMLGARIFEVHVTWSSRMFGPDTPASLTVEQLGTLIRYLSLQHQMASSPVDKDKMFEQKRELSVLFGRGIYAVRDLVPGEKLTESDMSFLKPSLGINAKHYKELCGKVIVREVRAGKPIADGDIE